MDQKIIKPNEGNNLKFMPESHQGGRGCTNPIKYFSNEDPSFNGIPITGESSESNNNLEYFTE